MATSGYVDTNIAPIEGASSIDPKAVRTSWNASFDEATLLWTVSWVSTVLGNPSYPTRWTTCHGGTTSFTSSYTMNPAAPSGTAPHIEKSRHGQELVRGSFTIAIDDDGNSSFTIHMSYHMNSSMASGLCEAEQSFSLDNKPQASTVSSSSSLSISQTSGTLSCTITSKKANYHRLYYGLDESTALQSGEISLANSGYTANTLTASITYSQILAKFPSAASGTLYFYVRTYKDSARSQTVGNLRNFPVSITISANASGIGPTISLGAISVNSSGVNTRLVAGYSKAQSVATVHANSSASVARIDYSIAYSSGATTTNGSNSASSTTIVSPVLPASTSNYTVTINATVYDTRGGSATATAVTATAYGYAVPNITATIYRTSDSSGSSPIRDDAGAYVYVAYNASYYTVDGQNSIQSIGCTRTGASGNISSGSFIAFSESQRDVFTVTARDRVTSTSVTVNIYPVKFPLELFDDKQGNDDSVLVKTGGNIRIVKETSPSVEFKPDSWDGDFIGKVIAQTSLHNQSNIRHMLRFNFTQYSWNSTTGKKVGYYDAYRLPESSTNLTQNNFYDILTSKNPITIAQGGTGATDADTARNNLNAARKSATSEGVGIPISANDDLNNYIYLGKYHVGSNSVAADISNMPPGYSSAFMLYVLSGNGSSGGPGAWKYLVQVLVSLNGYNYYTRSYFTNASGTATWGSWKKICGADSLFSGSLTSSGNSCTVDNVSLYNYLMIGGDFTSNHAFTNTLIPVNKLSSSSSVQAIFSDDVYYCRVSISLSDDSATITIAAISRDGGSGLTTVYGVC